jgi:hypothetical protein
MKWIMQQFPNGEWSWGWVAFVIVLSAVGYAIVIHLNIRDGYTWNGKEKP